MKKTIRTMRGKEIDFDKLILQNENVRAVGNMKVTANGKEVDDTTKSGMDRGRRIKNTFRRQIGKKVFDMPVPESKKEAKKEAMSFAESYTANIKEIEEINGIEEITIEPEPVDVDSAPEIAMQEAVKVKPPRSGKSITPEEQEKLDEEARLAEIAAKKAEDERLQTVKEKSAKGGGLARAIAKAKEVKQQPMKSPREQLRAEDGVKKI